MYFVSNYAFVVLMKVYFFEMMRGGTVGYCLRGGGVFGNIGLLLFSFFIIANCLEL